ncbi:MAG: RNase P subunit p30 family protein [Halobacteriales archaeon]
MYEAVRSRPEGESTVARLAATAADCGFEGVVVRNHGDGRAAYDAAAIRDRHGVDVVDGVELRADDPGRLAGFLGSHRPERTVVCVHGGSGTANRFAANNEQVDVLAHPTRGAVDDVLARTAAEHGVRLEVDLGPVLREDGGRRVREIADLRRLRDLIEAYDVPHVVTAGATGHLDLRAPRELAAVGEAIGLDGGWIEAGLAEWGRLAERNREREARYVEAGVRRGPYEADG